jgi:hypothetical protein
MSENGVGLGPRQVEDTYVLEEKTIDSSYIIGSKPGVSLHKNVNESQAEINSPM